MRRAFLATSLTVALAIPAFVACGNDNQNGACGAGTVLVNGQCVVAPSDTSTNTDTTVPDTTTPTDTATTTPTDTATTTPTDTATTNPDTTVTIDTSGECTADEASKLDVSFACTKDCQCRQDLKLKCYHGIYMEGFSFCSKVADNTLKDTDGYYSVLMVKGCFPTKTGNSELNTRIYVRSCQSMADCEARSSAYTHCGTKDAGFSWAVDPRGLECYNFENVSSSTMSGQRSCIIDDALPFNQKP